MEAPKVYIVTAGHNRSDVTKAFCACLERQTYKDFLLVFVDDGSTDSTPRVLRSVTFPCEICTGDGHLWWSGSLRRGMARLSALNPKPHDLVLLVNDDTSFEDTFLEKSVREALQLGSGTMMSVSTRFTDTKLDSAGCFVCDWPRFTFRDFGSFPERIDCASTRCLFLFYSDLKRCGGFRPRLLRHYLSDFEFTIRGHRHGIRITPASSITCTATQNTTGVHRPPSGGFLQVTRHMLSPGFSGNPVTLFMFILLAAPLPWKPVSWFWAARTCFSFFLRAAIWNRLRRGAARP